MAANPQTKPIDLGCESAEYWQLPSTSTVAIVIITLPVSWYSFYLPTEGGRMSRPRYYSRGVQPEPEVVYRSGCHDKHNRPWCDSNLGPLTLQSDTLTTRPLRPANMAAFIKPDVRNVSQCRQRRTEPRPWVALIVRAIPEICSRTDKHTWTDTVITVCRRTGGRSNNVCNKSWN